MNVFEIEGWVSLTVVFLLLAIKIFAFVNCLLFPAEAYQAAGKLTKPAWAIILGLGMVISVLVVQMPFFISLAFTIAALVYLVDVRPALSGLRRR
ncbi:MAG: hypothetical protein JWO11_2113 [Nocardioides sp.]|nr:hypothetical protein [Nocardioides sp.]